MPDKKPKHRKSREESVAVRVYRHWKSLKMSSSLRWVKDYDCEGCFWSTWPHMHGHYETTTSNDVWKQLARAHKMKVREVKDIVTRRRNRKHQIKHGDWPVL